MYSCLLCHVHSQHPHVFNDFHFHTLLCLPCIPLLPHMCSKLKPGEPGTILWRKHRRSDLVAQVGGCPSFRSLPSPTFCHQLLRSSDLQCNTEGFQLLKNSMSTVEWQQKKLILTRSSCRRKPTHNIRQSAGQHTTFVRERPCQSFNVSGNPSRSVIFVATRT